MTTNLTRRSVLKAGAWSVPAVTVAATSRQYATSNAPEQDPAIGVSCVDTPGRHAQTVRLTVRLTPEPTHPALVLIGTQVARYDRHTGYYVDVRTRPSRPLVVTVTYRDSRGRLQVMVERHAFDCTGCTNAKPKGKRATSPTPIQGDPT